MENDSFFCKNIESVENRLVKPIGHEERLSN